MSVQDTVFIEPKRRPGRPRKNGLPTGEPLELPREKSLKERFDRLTAEAHAVQPDGKRLIEFGRLLIELRNIYFDVHLPKRDRGAQGHKLKNSVSSKYRQLGTLGIKPFAEWASEEFDLNSHTVHGYMSWGRNPETYHAAKTLIRHWNRSKVRLQTGSRALDIAKAAFEKLSIEQRREFFDWVSERMEEYRK